MGEAPLRASGGAWPEPEGQPGHLGLAVEPPDGGMAEAEPPAPTCRFYLEGRCHFGARCRLPHPGAEAGPGPPLGPPPGKKAPMKTARAVIDRIRWDQQLDPADFSVGYVDRFRGVLEEPFTAFCWDQDLAALGPGVLAVPQHRIRYFRHRGRLVWDRASRTDLVFGSAAGRGTTILDGATEAGEAGAAEAGPPGEDAEPAPGAPGEDEAAEPGPQGEPPSSSGGVESQGRPPDGSSGVEAEDYEEGCPGLRPTHFVALPIDDPGLRLAVARAQARLVAAEPSVASCLVDPDALHLTLVLLRLAGPGEEATAAGALRRLVRAPGFHPPEELHFRGLASLDSRVIYSVPSPDLRELARAVAQQLEAQGLRVLERPGQALGPHLTLAKVPRGSPGRLSLAGAHEGAELGRQAVEGLALCSVGGRSAALAQVPLEPSRGPEKAEPGEALVLSLSSFRFN
ncbi:leukocyte receptor cluster member 9 [Gracilinanus agilis]|uniref:leukocyte receptor cluster member 9 n=1 Tax=Gracilinanus agilis TaxID=191870 RepID=UPI001CFCC95A|nr:leukocyte receptor cluster member 9 [Gracilinanus agilis]